MSTPGNLANGKTASLTAVCGGPGRLRVKLGERLARHHPGRDLGHRHAGGLGDERHGAAGAGVDLQDVDLAVLDGELHVHQPDHLQRLGQQLA